MNLQHYIDQSHKDSQRWWLDIKTGERIERSKTDLLMLIVTEIAEAAEGVRKDCPDDKLPHRKMEEVEIADALIRIFDYCGGFGITLLVGDMDLLASNLNILGNHISEAYVPPARSRLTMLLHCVRWATSAASEVEVNPGDKAEAYSLGRLVTSLLWYAHGQKMDIEGAYQEKRKFNLTREDHTHHARRQPGGKKQ